jgi:hypothetical protein
MPQRFVFACWRMKELIKASNGLTSAPIIGFGVLWLYADSIGSRGIQIGGIVPQFE